MVHFSDTFANNEKDEKMNVNKVGWNQCSKFGKLQLGSCNYPAGDGSSKLRQQNALWNKL